MVALHYAPGHWCCTTADLDNGQLVYYDPFYNDPHRAGALGALGAFVDQVTDEQGTEGATGATSFVRSVKTSPRQPDDMSCGVCVLTEVQRITGEKMNAQRAYQFTEMELLRLRAKWACELLLNSTPTPGKGRSAAADERASEERADPEDGINHRRRLEGGGETGTQKRPQSDPGDSGRKDAITKRRRSDDRLPEGDTAPLQARTERAGSPPCAETLSEREAPPGRDTRRAALTWTCTTASLLPMPQVPGHTRHNRAASLSVKPPLLSSSSQEQSSSCSHDKSLPRLDFV